MAAEGVERFNIGENEDKENVDPQGAPKLNHDCSFKNVWIPFVDELNVPGRDMNEQKLEAVANMILKIQTETLCFFPIVEFFEGNSKSMVEILKKISGKREITEFRFLEDDSFKNKEDRLKLEWNDFKLSENLKSDLEEVRVELKKMSNLHTIKIDVYPIFLKDLMDMCENLRSLKTLEVVMNFEIALDEEKSKVVRRRMGQLESFKYNGVVKNNFYKNISYFEKKLDEFFIRSLPHAKVIGQPGRFVDIVSVVEQMDELNDESRLTHIAHKLRGDVRKPLATFFPNLKQLQIEWCLSEISSALNFDAFLMFPNLRHLTLTNVPESDHFENFMLAYEQKLSDVTVKFGTSTQLCMKHFQGLHLTLRKLVVGVIKPHLGETFWSLRNFESLTELEIEFAVTWDSIDAICVVPICDLFLAPNLEKVRLLGQLAVDAEHLEAVHEMIVISRNILRSVNHFEMQLIKQGSAFFVTASREEIVKKEKLCDSITEFYKEEGLTVSIEFVALYL